jgi:hypothetical protein
MAEIADGDLSGLAALRLQVDGEPIDFGQVIDKKLNV